MAVYVDNVRLPYGRLIMCHLWADTEAELLDMVDRIGLARKWVQRPPRAQWLHFDVSLAFKRRALAAGAVLVDKYGPAYHVARLRGDRAMIRRIHRLRIRSSKSLFAPLDGTVIM